MIMDPTSFVKNKWWCENQFMRVVTILYNSIEKKVSKIGIFVPSSASAIESNFLLWSTLVNLFETKVWCVHIFCLDVSWIYYITLQMIKHTSLESVI